MGLIGASLLDIDPNGDFIPYLAESYQVSSDGLRWSFVIRQGITHHDGTPFNARTYRRNLERAMDPATGARISASYLSLVDSITTPTDYEMIFHLEAPYLPFGYYLADGSYLGPISEAALEKYGQDYGQHPSSVGAFKLKEWISGEEVILERNDEFRYDAHYYRNSGPMKFKEISFKIIPERATTVAALETGIIDITGVPVEERARFKRERRFQLFELEHPGVSLYILFNLDKPLFKDKNIRLAFNHAIEKQAIIMAAMEGYAQQAYGPATPLMKGYSSTVEDMAYSYDPDLAREYLARSGWVDSDGDGIADRDGESLRLVFPITGVESWTLASELLQAQLHEIGISLEIRSYELGTLLDTYGTGDYDLGLMGYTWTADCDILNVFFHSSEIGSGMNYSFSRSPELDELLTKARQSPNEEIGFDYYRLAQEYIVREALIVPIYVGQDMYAVNPRVKDINIHPLGWWLYQDAYLEAPVQDN